MKELIKQITNQLGYVGTLCVFAIGCITVMSVTQFIFVEDCGCKTEGYSTEKGE